MAEQRRCDICDRHEADLMAQMPDGAPPLEIDPDGLWVCRDCQARLTTSPVGDLVGGAFPIGSNDPPW